VWSFREAGDPAAEDWIAARALAVLAGDSDRAAQEIAAEADAAGLEGKQRAGADACVRYLGNKRKFLRYGQALQAGWPIASGAIGGAWPRVEPQVVNAVIRIETSNPGSSTPSLAT
jgi:hypothetical protein